MDCGGSTANDTIYSYLLSSTGRLPCPPLVCQNDPLGAVRTRSLICQGALPTQSIACFRKCVTESYVVSLEIEHESGSRQRCL